MTDRQEKDRKSAIWPKNNALIYEDDIWEGMRGKKEKKKGVRHIRSRSTTTTYKFKFKTYKKLRLPRRSKTMLCRFFYLNIYIHMYSPTSMIMSIYAFDR